MNAVATGTGRNSASLIGLAKSAPSNDAAIEELYLASLSRPPTAAEKASARKYLASGNRRQGLEDLLWALINSKEFLFRH